MRAILARILILMLAAAIPGQARAASVCTSYLEYLGDRDGCLTRVRDRTERAGFKHSLSGDTFYFWFDDDVVMVRCIANYSIIVFAAYHRQDGQACPLSDRISDTLR